MMKLLLGGTSDSTAIVKMLLEEKIPVTTSVATDYGRVLAEKYEHPIIQGRMSAEDMVAFINANQVDEIIDATHPFAEIVSVEAMKAATMAGVRYIRFERESTQDLTGAIVVSSMTEAIETLKTLGDVIYLGTGSKTLKQFVDGLPNKRIVARVLPTVDVLVACEEAGLVADQIDALKAPFTKELNKELLKRAKADVFVSKESGSVGGIREKIDTCLELGIDCVIISRPKMQYANMVSTVTELKNYLLNQK